MRTGAPTWRSFVDGNSPNVRFVTFNFDTILESQLTKSLRAFYANERIFDDEVQEALPVTHVHGRLSQPPEEPLAFDTLRGVPKEWITWTQQAAMEVRVVSDQIDQSVLDTAHAAVQNARVVCFLGFGYGRDNLKRLGICDRQSAPDDKAFFGSAFGVHPGDQAVARDAVPELKLAEPRCDCLGTLQTLPIFIRR
jgi:hypothetical protein